MKSSISDAALGVCPFKRFVKNPNEHDHQSFVRMLELGKIPGSLHPSAAALGIDFLKHVAEFTSVREYLNGNGLSKFGSIMLSMARAKMSLQNKT